MQIPSLLNYYLFSPYYTLLYLWRLDWKTLHYNFSTWSLLPQNKRKDKHLAGFSHGKYDMPSLNFFVSSGTFRGVLPWRDIANYSFPSKAGVRVAFQRLILQNECITFLERREGELPFMKRKWNWADLRVLPLWDSGEIFREFSWDIEENGEEKGTSSKRYRKKKKEEFWRIFK